MNRFLRFLLPLGLVLFGSPAWSIESNVLLKPFTLAQQHPAASYEKVLDEVQKKLQSAGFAIVGRYSPYNNATVLIISSDELKKVAARSAYGGFAAALRVSVVNNGKQVQVSHNNPTYLGIAYRMNSDLAEFRKRLASSLGYIRDYGGEGIPAGELPDYHYAFGLEKFNGFFELATYKSQAAALAAVEKGFSNTRLAMSKVYRVDVPGKQQSIFGVAMKGNHQDDNQKYINDEYVMQIIDHRETARAAHLPYEIMVNNGRVIAMHPHYRLAVNFPDLKMFGKNSFGRLMNLPYVYEEYLVQLAGGKWPREESEY